MRIESVQRVEHVRLSDVHTLIFAGGGNRCWWQAGVIKSLLDGGWKLPRLLVGTSAGAAIAAISLANKFDAALESCLSLYAGTPSIVDGNGWSRLRLQFAHRRVYPQWVSAFVNSTSFDVLHDSSTRVRVVFARPASFLGVMGSVTLGTLAYIADKYLLKSLHPRLPAMLGLKLEYQDIHQCQTVEEAQYLLYASASAPPFMHAKVIGGKAAFDGGYVDSVPVLEQDAAEQPGTLVLLTRVYEKLPALFRYKGRTYWQASHRIPVSTWDCTSRTDVLGAFNFGMRDAQRMLAENCLSW